MCELISAWTIANILALIMTPQICSGYDDYTECMMSAEIGCKMVEVCSEGTKIQESYQQCLERSAKKCIKIINKEDSQ